MKTFRCWHVLVLLGLTIDLVNPTMPGIFSLLQGDLFMDGVTRPLRSVAEATSVRDCARMRTAVDPPRAVAARAHVVVRDARRTHEHPDLRRSYVAAVPGCSDSEDH